MTETAAPDAPTPPTPPPDPSGTPTAPRPHSSEGRWLAALVVVALVLLVPTIGLRMLLPHGDTFCDRVGELPSVTASLEEDGTPGPAMVSYAEALDRLADAAPDASTADAARQLADHEREVGRLISGVSSSADVATRVSDLDGTDPAALSSARTTLDDAIGDRCG